MNRKNNVLTRSGLGIHTCRQGHDHGSAKFTLIYNTDNVLAFGVNIKVGEQGQKMRSITQWFSRDQFSDWLPAAPSGAELELGACSARIKKSSSHALTLKFAALTLTTGVHVNPYLLLARGFLTKFLDDTYVIVPRMESVENSYLQIDACIERILSSSK